MRKLKLDELGRLTADEYKSAPKTPLILLLDNIRSALNVGSIFRTSDAYRIKEIFLCGITAKPPHREILKTAIGAQDTVDWRYFDDVVDAANYSKEQGYYLIGIEQTDSGISLQDFNVPTDTTLVVAMGNEVEGLSKELLPKLDACVELPQFGTKHSLNVAVCAGIVVWDLYWKLKE